MRTLKQPIKVIDNFFESPDLWRMYALDQSYSRDKFSPWPGVRSATLNEINMELFRSLASKLISHIHDKTGFAQLKVNFASADGSFGSGWMHQDEPIYNVAGIIYLNKDAPAGTGTSFYNKIATTDRDYNQMFLDELDSDPKDRTKFEKFKLDQKSLFKVNMTVENVFNRCVMFPPGYWHSVDKFFGNTIDDSRLTINFFGTAV